VHVVAILEKRVLHWYVYLPTLGCGSAVPEPGGAQATAVTLVSAVTGLPEADVLVSLRHTHVADTLLPTPPSDVEVRHSDGTWRAARHVGWLRPRDGSWKPLVAYTADGAQWERAVHASHFREPARESAEIPLPRTGRVEVDVAGV